MAVSTQKAVGISAAVALVVVIIYLIVRPKREGYRAGGGSVPKYAGCRAALGKVAANSRGKVTLSFGSFTLDWTARPTEGIFYAPLGSTWRVYLDSTNRPCPSPPSPPPQLIRMR